MMRPSSLLFLAAPLALGLAACSPGQQERGLAVDPVAAGQSASGVMLSEPVTGRSETRSFAVLALPADAGRAGRLTEKQFANGWRQNLALDGGKEAGDWNALSIDIQTATPGERQSNAISIDKPTPEGVRREILARIHGAPMRIVGRPMHNALGSFGLAVGAGPDGLRCALAWQWVENLRAVARGEGRSLFNSGEMPASIRMRLCRRGVSADQLAEWYGQLQIADVANVERIAEAMQRAAEGRAGEMGPGALVDNSASLENTLIRSADDDAGVTRRDARRHAARHAARRRPTPESESEFESPAPMTTPSSPSVDGRQYLAPVPGASASAGPGYAPSAPPQTPRGAGFGPVRLDPGLPAQAYRGPSTARAIMAPGAGGQPVYLGQPGR